MDLTTIFQNSQQELKRGALVLAVLTQLDDIKYGYSLLQDLKQKGLEIEQNTLYPLLRRLETQGLLDSQWELEDKRPRRYYRISPGGTELRSLLVQEWNVLNTTMKALIGDTK